MTRSARRCHPPLGPLAVKSNRVLAATSIGMGGGMYAFDWLRRARDAGYENGLPGLAVAAEPAHRQR